MPDEERWSEAEIQRLLGEAYRRGAWLRWRGRIVRATASVMVAALLTVGGINLAGGAAPSTGSFVHPDPTAAVTDTTDLGSVRPSPRSTVEPVPSSAPPTPRQRSGCLNSFDPACGPFRWLTKPFRDAPLTITVTFSPAEPRVGQRVTFTVRAIDPDAEVTCCSVEYGPTYIGEPIPPCRRGAGPWQTPDREAGDVTRTFHHVFEAAGEHRVAFYASSGNHGCLNPYGGTRTRTVPITVTASPDPEPTPAATP